MKAEPTDLSPREARDRFLSMREADATDRTLRSYRNRLTRFVEWCEREGIERVGDLTPWAIDQYAMSRRQADLAPTTIRGQLATLRVLLKYLERIGAVEDDLADAVETPDLSADEMSSDQRLRTEDAEALLRYFRDSRARFGTPKHAFLEVAWHTGARIGTLRGLDVEDFDAEAGTLTFRHRPSTGTPLKNKDDAERIVAISSDVVEALRVYMERERSDKRDDHGRQPLFSARQGRPSFTTFRSWSYQATQPCLYSPCPHGKERGTCDWTKRSESSKCPSSRSPHRIRTGSITWHLNQGMDPEKVATRCNVSLEVLHEHYDVASAREEFEQRRRDEFSEFDISGGNHE